jgi:hypothetical protein
MRLESRFIDTRVAPKQLQRTLPRLLQLGRHVSGLLLSGILDAGDIDLFRRLAVLVDFPDVLGLDRLFPSSLGRC